MSVQTTPRSPFLKKMETAPILPLAQQWTLLPSTKFKKRREPKSISQDHSKLEEIPASLHDIRSSMMKTRFSSSLLGVALERAH
jgi:hypothetical protein